VSLLERLRPPHTFRIEQRIATFGLRDVTVIAYKPLVGYHCDVAKATLMVDEDFLLDICWENRFADTQRDRV
jgi:hypothetical protein